MSSGLLRNGLVYLLIIVAVAALVFSIFSGRSQAPQVDISRLAEDVKAGAVKKLLVQGDSITIEYRDPGIPDAASRKEPNTTLIETLDRLGVTSEYLKNMEVEVETPVGRRDRLDYPADVGNLGIRYLAQEFQREVHNIGVHPFGVALMQVRLFLQCGRELPYRFPCFLFYIYRDKYTHHGTVRIL